MTDADSKDRYGTQPDGHPRPAEEPVHHWPHLTEEERKEDEQFANRRYSRRRMSKSPEAIAQSTPFTFYRKLHPSEEAMLESLLAEHPTLTREEALEMMEAFGF